MKGWIRLVIVAGIWCAIGWSAAGLHSWLWPVKGWADGVWKPVVIGYVVWIVSGFADALFPRGSLLRDKAVDRIRDYESAKRRPTDNIVEGSVGERLFGVAYRSSQIVNILNVASADAPEARLRVLNAMPGLVAEVYFDAAAIQAVLPAAASDLMAPDVLIGEQSSNEQERAAARVRLVLQAYANYRAQAAAELAGPDPTA